MKDLLKNQAGAIIVVIILVVVLAAAGGGAAFLAVRMVVSGDGNFLQPFEELGWIDSKDDDSEDKEKSKSDDDKDDGEDEEDDDDDEEKAKDKKDTKKDTEKDTKKSGSKEEYLVEDSRLSSESKKSSTEHYYGEISLANEIGDEDDEFADLYKLMKAGVNVYAQDGKAVEIEFGFDISEFCKEAYEQYKDDFVAIGMNSSDDIQDMMMNMIETMFDEFDDEYSEYVTKYIDGGSFQLYVTEKGFESLYETYNITDGEDDIEVLIDALEDSFSTTISLVKD